MMLLPDFASPDAWTDRTRTGSLVYVSRTPDGYVAVVTGFRGAVVAAKDWHALRCRVACVAEIQEEATT